MPVTATRVRWYLGSILLHQHEVGRAIPLLQAAVALEQEIHDPEAAKHTEQLAHVQARLARNGH